MGSERVTNVLWMRGGGRRRYAGDLSFANGRLCLSGEDRTGTRAGVVIEPEQVRGVRLARLEDPRRTPLITVELRDEGAVAVCAPRLAAEDAAALAAVMEGGSGADRASVSE